MRKPGYGRVFLYVYRRGRKEQAGARIFRGRPNPNESNMSNLQRSENRTPEQSRGIRFTPHFLKQEPHSVLVEYGNTRVLCVASFETKIPRWMSPGQETGWVTAEYNMLPRSSPQRIRRERNGASGRTQEIQRLIARSLRAAVDLKKLGQLTITVDCDVIEADGGTRTASITGAFVAMASLLESLHREGILKNQPIKGNLAAMSLGKVDDEIVVDLDYPEDSRAQVDCNLVTLDGHRIVEIQGTGEEGYFSPAELQQFLDLGLPVMDAVFTQQNQILRERMNVETYWVK